MGKIKEKLSGMAKNSSLTLKQQIGYSSGTFGNAMAQDTVHTYAEQFMYDYMGLSNGNILLLKSLTNGINILSAPIVGSLLDGGKPGSNRTIKFMLASSIPTVLASILLFVTPKSSAMFRVLWVFLLYFLFNIADTFFDVSLLTLSTRIIDNAGSRKSLYTIAEFASTLGSMLPGWILPVIVGMQNGNFEAEKRTYFLIALIFGLLGLTAMLIPCFTLREKMIVKRQIEKKVSIDFKLIFMNKPLMLLSLANVITSVRQVCYQVLPFFYKQTLQNFKMKSIVEACSGALSYSGLMSVPFVGKRLSSRDMVSYGYIWTGTLYVLLGLLGYKNHIIVGAIIALAGMPNAAMSAAKNILLADSVDYLEWKTYKKYGTPMRNEGMVFAFDTMVDRVSRLWKDLIINVALGIIGYKSAEIVNGESVAAVQSPETLKGLFWLVVIPGIIGNLIPGIIMLFDDFNGEKRTRIMDELSVLRMQAFEESTQAGETV